MRKLKYGMNHSERAQYHFKIQDFLVLNHMKGRVIMLLDPTFDDS